jgi:hypothetical protein
MFIDEDAAFRLLLIFVSIMIGFRPTLVYVPIDLSFGFVYYLVVCSILPPHRHRIDSSNI